MLIPAVTKVIRRSWLVFYEQLLAQKMSREIVSRIQKLRKKAGLQVGEVVEVRLYVIWRVIHRYVFQIKTYPSAWQA